MKTRNLIVIGASAGGIEALINLVGGLPVGLPAAIFVVVHIRPQSRSNLPDILSRRGYWPAQHAQDGLRYRAGMIYVAPPDRHLQLHDGLMRVHVGPWENNHRPAIDPLFRSAATVRDARVFGVVLSGTLDDGTAGLAAIKRRGGIVIAQDPDDAVFDSMPRSALEKASVDHIAPAATLGPLLARLVVEPWPEAAPDLPPAPSLADIASEARLSMFE